MHTAKRRFLIITADDFGLHEAVNDAVEQASRAGVLTAASLMVAAPAARDAVRRTRALPDLRIGLHLVLADGCAVLAPHLIPALADTTGRMNSRMFTNAVRYFFLPRVRAQVAAEVRAQFTAFARTGLVLDHVNVHKHFHLHPSLLEIVLRIGREFGLSAMRVPHEPLWFAARRGRPLSGANALLLAPWTIWMKRRLQAARILHNDNIFGVAASGAMDEAKILEIVARLPPGITEIYMHPGTVSGALITASMNKYRHADELAALLSPQVRAAIDSVGVELGGYGDALRAHGLITEQRC
jgi:hopanoid biosynthesis associated protein HpnK